MTEALLAQHLESPPERDVDASPTLPINNVSGDRSLRGYRVTRHGPILTGHSALVRHRFVGKGVRPIGWPWRATRCSSASARCE